MTPYYEDESCVIYNGDCRDIMPELDFDVIVTDPPYGINANTKGASTWRAGLAASNDYAPVQGDDVPFDPALLLAAEVPTVMFGANHYGSRLPDASRWLVWDKLDGLKSCRDVGFNDQADVELAWTNFGGPARMFSHRWMGIMKTGEDAKTKRRHPTEKPVELMRWCMIQTPPGVILDPFMGSGTTLRAAKDLGRKAIGIELDRKYCDIAVKRLAQEVLDFGATS